MNYYYNRTNIQGKISLVIIILLGIFCIVPSYAAVTETVSLTATQKAVASFSFDISPLNSRKYIYPNKVSFDTTGKVATTTPVPAYTRDFPAWDSGYPVNDWSRVVNHQTITQFYDNFTQIYQFPHNYAVPAYRDKFLVCGLPITSSKILYGICDSFSSLVSCYSSMSNEVSTEDSSSKAFATVISSTRAYCFWTYKPSDSVSVIKMNYFTNTWGNTTTISDSLISEKWGVSACLMRDGSDEYIVVAYPNSENSISIISFKDGNPNSYTINSGFGVINGISGAQITISQNPRTGNVYLGWISGTKAYYKTGSFQPNSYTKFSFANTEREICSVNYEKAAYATIYAGSYNNFETSFTVSDDDSIRNYCICGEHSLITQTLSGSNSIPKLKFAAAFEYFENDNYYSGCICCSNFRFIDFYSRLLEYPKACSWQASKKTLHLEGPPRLNTLVTAQVDFAEMVPSDTFARCVNSDFVGGVRCFNNSFNVVGEKAVIASSSQCFFAIGFDKSMNVASFSNELNSSVKLTESGTGNQIGLTNIASISGRFVFKPNSDLNLNSSYIITIASDVVDAVGTQIYKNETLSFKTQLTSTPLDSEGVIKLDAFSDANCTSQIPDNSDVKSDKKLYLRLNAYDPAFNTIDTTTIKVKKDGNLITTLNLVQREADSNYFYCEYQMSAPIDIDSNWTFETVNSDKKLSLKVNYPVLSPITPASGAVNLEPGNISKIEISASEDLNSSSINTTNISLRQQTENVSINVNYDNANRKILITPTSVLSSEKNYFVRVSDILDKAGNKQLSPLIYYFSTRDNTAPTITQCFPANASTNITIDTKPQIVFSEEILASTVTKNNVVVTCNGASTDYSLEIAGNKVIVNITNGLRTESNYKIELKTGITDYSGNHVASTYSYTFSTQPAHTKPSDILSLTLYKEGEMFNTFGNNEKVNAKTKVYFKLNAVDGATQTLDVATISISLNGLIERNLILYETASNSGGLFTGTFDLDSLSLYAFPSTIPSVDINEISFASTQKTTVKAGLKTIFPKLNNSLVSAVAGNIEAVNAVNVFIDSQIKLDFSEELDEASITNTALTLASGTTNINFTKSLSSDRKTITILPIANLPFSSTITLNAIYATTGLKDVTGNPIKGPINLSFRTQKENTAPTVINEISLFSDSSMSAVYKYADNQDFYKNGILYIEAKGNDATPNTLDNTSVTITGGTKVILTETGVSTGIFRGSYQCVNISDGTFSVTSDVTPSITKNLILTTPILLESLPSNGATNVSNAQAIKLVYSEPLSISTVNNENIILKKKSSSEKVSVSIVYSEGSNEVLLRPNSVLDFLTEYEVSISNIKDVAGNEAANTSFSFTTQDSATQPSIVNSLSVYSDVSYTVSIASGTVLPPAVNVFVSVEATDASPTTLDYINLCVKDNTNNQTKNISIPETAINSGLFRGTAELFENENSYISVYTIVDTTKSIGLKTDFYPTFVSFNPASNSTNLYLDNQIEIISNKEIDATSVSKSSIILEGSSGEISYEVSRSDTNKILISNTKANAGDRLSLTLTNTLKDKSGLSFPYIISTFMVRNKNVNSFKIFKNAAFTNELADGSNVESNQEIYCELNGVDLTQNGLTDTMEIAFSDGDIDNKLLLTEVAAGKYRGSLNVPNSPGKIFKVSPVGFTEKTINLNILEPFNLIEYYPASGSIGIPADAWPSWTFNRIIPNSQLLSNNFSVYDVESNSVVGGTLSLSPSGKQVRFKPNSVFETSKVYEMRLSSDIYDSQGNNLGFALKTRFTIQPPPMPPTELISFANYSDENYNSTATAILSNSNLYIQMVANDPSFSTFEKASVRLDSDDGTYDGVVVSLIETNPPSGIFRLKYPVFLPSGTILTLTPQVDDSFAIRITVQEKPRLLSLSPASGSIDIYLDSSLEMNFSSSLDTNDFENNIEIKDSKGEIVLFNYKFENSDKKVLITTEKLLSSNESYFIKVNNLKNKSGQTIDKFTYKFSTRKETSASFELYTGLAPCDGKKVSETGEIVRGLLGIVASSSDLLKLSEENRILKLSDASHSVEIYLNETGLNTNLFVASTTIDSSFESPIKAELLFGSRPYMNFDIASPTYLVSISPAEKEEVPENTLVNAIFSRKIYIESAKTALKIGSEESEIKTTLLNDNNDSENIKWKPEKDLLEGNKHILSISGLLDYLGQSIGNYNHEFYTGGNHGISLYSDYSFKNKITSKEISSPNIYVEVVGFNTSGLNEDDISLELTRGTEASTTRNLKMISIGDSKKIYRCALNLAETKSTLPSYSLGLYPGEWVMLRSPMLTTNKVIFYYRYSMAESPQVIKNIKFFSEKKYIRRVVDEISNPSLYIEVEAEDLNWLTQDTTKVRVCSDDDRTGFVVDLTENGTHSSSFRGLVKISENASDPLTNTLKVSFGKRITVVSETDKSIKASIRYFPKAEIINFTAYPSPAKRNYINFRFYLNFSTGIKISIYDVSGKKIDSFEIDGKEGENIYRWNFPRKMANGVYIYRVKSLGTGTSYTYAKMVKGKFAVLR